MQSGLLWHLEVHTIEAVSDLSQSPQSSSYSVPASPVEVEYEIKKSRFIARAALAQDRSAAKAVLAQAKLDFPDARHHCWAYQIGSPQSPSTVACSDDGEPSGTAGKPILNVLQHKTVGDVMLVVIRYFGGIKLGAGGLVRAYSQAAQMAMTELPTRRQEFLQAVRVSLEFAQEQPLRHWLSTRGGQVLGVDYQQQVTVDLALAQDSLPELEGFLAAHRAHIVTK